MTFFLGIRVLPFCWGHTSILSVLPCHWRYRDTSLPPPHTLFLFINWTPVQEEKKGAILRLLQRSLNLALSLAFEVFYGVLPVTILSGSPGERKPADTEISLANDVTRSHY